jgi:hypothetical protein
MEERIEARKRTLTTLSQPQETITGFWTFGLNLTQETLRIDKNEMFPLYRCSRSPFGVALILDIILAFSKSVPELDCAIAGARNDLTVVGAEANREDVGSVSDKAAGGSASVQVPETKSVVPGGRESELAVRRYNNVRNEVVVAVEDTPGVTIRVLIASELPDDDGLVYRDIQISHIFLRYYL